VGREGGNLQMKTVIVIQARMGSSRLPGKVLMPLGISPVLGHCLASAIFTGYEVIVATPTLPQDDPIIDYVKSHDEDVACIRGSESDVLARFVQVAEETNADVLVRLTGDCPFHDPQVIREVIKLREMTGADYATNTDPPTYPDGLDVEVFTRRALMEAHAEATRPSDRDCVTQFIRRNRYRYKAANLTCPLPGLVKERWVLDTEEDYEFCQEIAKRITSYPPSYLDILAVLEKEPKLRRINGHLTRNERFYEALITEQQEPRTCPTSAVLLANAERLIPLGAQTFSKSKLQYPEDAPLFVTHGDGAYVFDADGNDYVDLVSGLLPNILGYRDPDVDQAIRDQLSRGISFSMSTTLEAELAARLANYIPCAEMSRFGKNGTDVTTAAVRLARAYTGRNLVLKAANGYHGWADWAVSNDSLRNLGSPINQHVDTFSDWPDLIGVTTNKWANYAAVIIEPETNPELLRQLRDFCTKTGTLLIFDEVITGFRFGMGGAQQFYGVTPDLACFGKAMGNGMPISALVGKREIMKLMEKVCFSGTFFGEALSLAAAIATIDKLDRCDVPKHLEDAGNRIIYGVLPLLMEYGLEEQIRISGHPSLLRLSFTDPRVRTVFMKSMKENGVLIIASNNINYAMKEPQIKKIIDAYDEALLCISVAMDSNSLDSVEAATPTVRGAA